MNDEKSASDRHENEATGASASEEISGADAAGESGPDRSDSHRHDETGVREEGDIAGATSTHAGAGGAFDNTGGTGTAPTSD